MFTPVGMVPLDRPRRGCYKLVLEHGYSLFGSYLVLQIWVDVLVMHACQLFVALTLMFHLLIALHHINHGRIKVIMANLMLILWNESS